MTDSEIWTLDHFIEHVFTDFQDISKEWVHLKSKLFQNGQNQMRLSQDLYLSFTVYLKTVRGFLRKHLEDGNPPSDQLKKDFKHLQMLKHDFLIVSKRPPRAPFVSEEVFQESVEDVWKKMFHEMGVLFISYFLRESVFSDSIEFPASDYGMRLTKFFTEQVSLKQKYVFWLQCCVYIRQMQTKMKEYAERPTAFSEESRLFLEQLQSWNNFYKNWDSIHMSMLSSLSSHWFHSLDQFRDIKHQLLGKYPVFFLSNLQLQTHLASQALEGLLWIYLFFFCQSESDQTKGGKGEEDAVTVTYPGDLISLVYENSSDFVQLPVAFPTKEEEEDENAFQEFCQEVTQSSVSEWSMAFFIPLICDSFLYFTNKALAQNQEQVLLLKQHKELEEIEESIRRLMLYVGSESQNGTARPPKEKEKEKEEKQKKPWAVWITPEEAEKQNTALILKNKKWKPKYF